MIKNRRDLAIALSNGKVDYSNVSKKLYRIVEMWIGYGDISKTGNFLISNN